MELEFQSLVKNPQLNSHYNDLVHSTRQLGSDVLEHFLDCLLDSISDISFFLLTEISDFQRSCKNRPTVLLIRMKPTLIELL